MCSISKENVFDAISTVIDPEVGFNLVEMGLIYDALVNEKTCDIHVIMTLSTQGCPLHQMIKQWVKEAVERIEDVGEVEVEVVWEPSWNISMADENVKAALSGAMPA
jgi:metal-sulfur cluster biosynthetic enzyme